MKKAKYYYSATAESETGQRLQAFMHKCAVAEEQARQWAEKMGAGHYYESPNGMAGGVSAVEFDNITSKEGWEKVVTPDGRSLFYPEPDSDIEKEMFDLPVVSEMELIGILRFVHDNKKEGRLPVYTFGNQTPIIFLHHGLWYMEVPYPSSDTTLTAITEKSFYRRRLAAVNEKGLASDAWRR